MRNRNGWFVFAAVFAVLMIAGTGCQQKGKEHGGKEDAGSAVQKGTPTSTQEHGGKEHAGTGTPAQ